MDAQKPEAEQTPADTQPPETTVAQGNVVVVKMSWPRAVMTISVVAILVLGVLLGVDSLRKGVEGTAKAVAKPVDRLLDKFFNTELAMSIKFYARDETNVSHLQFAVVDDYAKFDLTAEKSVLLKTFNARVSLEGPVQFIYYLDFDDEWRFLRDDRTLYVVVPDIRYNKPSLSWSRAKWRVEESSAAIDEDKLQDNLRQEVDYRLRQSAKRGLPSVRSNCREQVAEFVRKWLRKSFDDGAEYGVRILFRDEPVPEGAEPAGDAR